MKDLTSPIWRIPELDLRHTTPSSALGKKGATLEKYSQIQTDVENIATNMFYIAY